MKDSHRGQRWERATQDVISCVEAIAKGLGVDVPPYVPMRSRDPRDPGLFRMEHAAECLRILADAHNVGICPLPETPCVADTPRLPPVARFNHAPAVAAMGSIPDPLAVQFTTTSDPGNASSIGWEWNCGDGLVSYEQSPVHSYARVGIYGASLIVTTPHGSTKHEARVEVGLVEPRPDFGATSGFIAADYAPEDASAGAIELRDISDDQARTEIQDLFQTPESVLVYTDIAEALQLDLRQVVRVCGGLLESGEITFPSTPDPPRPTEPPKPPKKHMKQKKR